MSTSRKFKANESDLEYARRSWDTTNMRLADREQNAIAMMTHRAERIREGSYL
jgi:hypothetical protein